MVMICSMRVGCHHACSYYINILFTVSFYFHKFSSMCLYMLVRTLFIGIKVGVFFWLSLRWSRQCARAGWNTDDNQYTNEVSLEWTESRKTTKTTCAQNQFALLVLVARVETSLARTL